MTNIKKITIGGIIAAIYVVLCVAFNGVSFMALQFRIATLVTPFPFYFNRTKADRNIAIAGVTLGTIISNFFSPMGLIDILCALLIYFMIFIVFYKISVKNRFVQTICYALSSGIFVAAELYTLYHAPFLYSVLTVAISGFIIYFCGTYAMERITKILYKILK